MMKRIVSEAEMRRHELATCQRKQCSIHDLIGVAGKCLFDNFSRYYPNRDVHTSLLVLVGPGNNGRDALVFSDWAFRSGWKVTLLFTMKERPSRSSLWDFENCLPKENVLSLAMMEPPFLFLKDFPIIIDGIFGLGLNRAISGKIKELIDAINQQDAFVYALDLPSGLHADTGLVMGSAIRARATGALQFLKLGHLLNDGMDYSGEVAVLDLDLSFHEAEPIRQYLEITDFSRFRKTRPKRSHKYDYGSLLIIGGSKGMMGAPELAAASALRSGIGVVKVAVYLPDLPYYQPYFPEVMHVFYQSVDELDQAINQSDALLLGPGLGKQHPLASDLLKHIMMKNKPLLVDADGCFYLKTCLDDRKNMANISLTPHPGELGSLLDLDHVEVMNRPEDHLGLLTDKGATVVVKAHWTLIANQQETIYTGEGNPGMATAGSGDVLAGIIATFLAQHELPIDAAIKGVLLHQAAGRLARSRFTEAGMIASDLIANIPNAYLESYQPSQSDVK